MVLSIMKKIMDLVSIIDNIDNKMSGSLRKRGEVIGDMKITEKKIPIEHRFDPLEIYTKIMEVKRISVDDEEEEEEKLAKVKKIYFDFMGKELKGKSIPKKNDEGFYECSTTAAKEVNIEPTKLKRTIENWKNTSNFALKSDKYRYARVYVAYNELQDNSSYVWFIRMMKVENCREVDRFWESIKDMQ